MGFVQVIEFSTDRIDEVESLVEEWIAATAGSRRATRALLCRDRGRPDHFVQVVEFPSHEEAMANSSLPETGHFAERLTALCTAGPSFTDLDAVRVDVLG